MQGCIGSSIEGSTQQAGTGSIPSNPNRYWIARDDTPLGDLTTHAARIDAAVNWILAN
jgi:hypothetical protein